MADVGSFADAIRSERELRAALAHCETLPGAAAQFARELPAEFETLRPLLAEQKIGELYTHQSRALRLIEDGNNLVLATPTASGKTLVYNFSALRESLANPEGRSLYLFPLKALEWDQRQRLQRDIETLGQAAAHIRVAIYDGDTTNSQRR
ncbi:MAG: DEAD/DEAH box helicase, partial [Deltaproteobacteria bacterium]|nr:DEAD/DEAH box helicase [Deltaproteobacteria bacterium]